MFHLFSFRLGDDIVDLNLVNNGVVEMLRKELETMMNNLEEHLKKKYPTLIRLRVRSKTNFQRFFDFFLELTTLFDRFISTV